MKFEEFKELNYRDKLNILFEIFRDIRLIMNVFLINIFMLLFITAILFYIAFIK